MGLTLLIGGVRAGKSKLAVRRAAATGKPVIFLATARASDDEMTERIERHRADRPKEWATIEEPLQIEEAVRSAPDDATVVVDCLTLWVSNLMLDDVTEESIYERAEKAAEAAAARSGETIVVTNEVGAGVHPSSDLGRRFRDLLGWVNTIFAERAAEASLVIAGRTLTLERDAIG